MNDLTKTDDYRKEITDWFASDRNFNEGYLLFVRFSHNRALAMQFARKGETMQSKLEYELTKILERALIIERPVLPVGSIKKAIAPVVEMRSAITSENEQIDATVSNAGKVRVKREDSIDYDALSDDQKLLFDDNRAMYKEMRSWHEKMKLAKSDDERAGHRAKVVELDDTIRANWDKFDASFEPSGESHSDQANDEMNADPIKEIGNARSYISKAIKGISEGKIAEKKLEAVRIKAFERYKILVKLNQVIDDETLLKLKSCGIIVE